MTFIKNTNYGWHNTKRGGSDYLETYAPCPGTFKAHCVSHSYFWGSCNVRCRRTASRRWSALGGRAAVVLACALAAAVVASRIDDGSDLTAAIDEAPLTRVADIAAADGIPGGACTSS